MKLEKIWFLVIKEQIIDHNKKVFNNQKKKINHTEKFIEKFRYKSTKAKQIARNSKPAKATKTNSTELQEP